MSVPVVSVSADDTGSKTTGLNVSLHSQQEVIDYLENSGVNLQQAAEFEEDPVVEAPYSPGALTDETLNSAVQTFNNARYIAGLDPVSISSEQQTKIQTGALLMAINQAMTAGSEKPEGMSDEMYQAGRSGLSNASMYRGERTGYSLNSIIVNTWLQNSSASSTLGR